MNIKCVLFDTDGVIVSSEKFSTQYQKAFGISESAMSPFFIGVFQECMVGKQDLKVALEPFLKKWKWEGDAESLTDWWFKSEHHVDKRVVRLISDLKKKRVRCCLATNQEKYRTEYMRTQMRFNTLFDDIFSSAQLGYKKPSKEFFEEIFKKLATRYKYKKEEILFVDDTPENVEATNNFGFQKHLYKDFEALNKELKV